MRHLLLAAVLLIPTVAEARRNDPIELDLARICVSERGFTNRTHDCAAILVVLRSRARVLGCTLHQAMLRYSPRATGMRPQTGDRPWIAHLRADGRRPRHWRGLSWRTWYRGRWRKTQAYAVWLLQRDEQPCSEPAMHWGNDGDWRRHIEREPGAYRVDCGPTRNHFIRLPRLIRAGF